MKPVCLVIGAGAGIGGTVGRRFAREGYHAVLCRRSDSDGLEKMVHEIESDGGSATGFLLNAIELNVIEERGNHARRKQQLAARMGLAAVVLEEHAGRAVQLRHDDALGAVDEIGRASCRERV